MNALDEIIQGGEYLTPVSTHEEGENRRLIVEPAKDTCEDHEIDYLGRVAVSGKLMLFVKEERYDAVRNKRSVRICDVMADSLPVVVKPYEDLVKSTLRIINHLEILSRNPYLPEKPIIIS